MNAWILAAILAGNAADGISTELALRQPGLQEGNPIMRVPAVRASVKIGGTIAEVLMVRALWSNDHKKAAIGVALGIGAANGLIAVRNLRIRP